MKVELHSCYLRIKALSIYVFIQIISSCLGQLCDKIHNCALSFSTDIWLFADSIDFVTKELLFYARSDYGQTIITKCPVANSQFICGSSLSSVFNTVDLVFFFILLILLVFLKDNQFHFIFFTLLLFFLLNLSIAFFIIEKLSSYIIPFAGVLSEGQNSPYNTQLREWNIIALISKCSLYIKLFGAGIVATLLFCKKVFHIKIR